MKNENTIKYSIEPLYQSKGWIKLISTLSIIIGIIQCLSIIGIIFGWLPIYLGILLNRAKNKLEMAYETDNENELREASINLARYFTIMGVIALIALLLSIIGLINFILFVFLSSTQPTETKIYELF